VQHGASYMADNILDNFYTVKNESMGNKSGTNVPSFVDIIDWLIAVAEAEWHVTGINVSLRISVILFNMSFFF